MFDEAKLDVALGQISVLSERIDIMVGAINNERAEMGRRFEVHGESIALRNEKTIKEEIGLLGNRLDEKIDLLFQAKTAEQCSDIASIRGDVDEIKIRVDGIDTRTRDFPLMRGKIERLEAEPGTKAMTTVQRITLAVASVVSAGFAAFFTWLFTGGKS